MHIDRVIHHSPFISICIPQYDRTSFLLEALKVLAHQTFRDFEICISDDCSRDGRQDEIELFLENSGMAFTFQRQSKNLRYDGNIRSAIGLAKGNYCLLHGNDDCLASPTALQELYSTITAHGNVAVVIPNFSDWETGQITRRVRYTGIAGAGPEAAVINYRNVAFVTGVLIDRQKAQAIATDKWDGSEMYQMYVVARLLAAGGRLLTIDSPLVRKDIHLTGDTVDSYAKRPKLAPCPLEERIFPFIQIGRLVADAIDPYIDGPQRGKLLEKMISQLYLFTYPFWIFEYRKIQSWKYALGVCLGMRPRNVCKGINLGLYRTVRLRMLYGTVCLTGLTVPILIFERGKPFLYSIAKSFFSGRQGKQR